MSQRVQTPSTFDHSINLQRPGHPGTSIFAQQFMLWFICEPTQSPFLFTFLFNCVCLKRYLCEIPVIPLSLDQIKIFIKRTVNKAKSFWLQPFSKGSTGNILTIPPDLLRSQYTSTPSLPTPLSIWYGLLMTFKLASNKGGGWTSVIKLSMYFQGLVFTCKSKFLGDCYKHFATVCSM